MPEYPFTVALTDDECFELREAWQAKTLFMDSTGNLRGMPTLSDRDRKFSFGALRPHSIGGTMLDTESSFQTLDYVWLYKRTPIAWHGSFGIMIPDVTQFDSDNVELQDVVKILDPIFHNLRRYTTTQAMTCEDDNV